MLTKFNDVLDEQVNFGMPLKTSNLWPELLISWLDQLDLQSGSVKNLETLLESLVRNRNEIAHGKKLIVSSREDLDKYSNAALLAMHEVAIGVVISLENKSYKRVAAGETLLNQAI